MCAYMFHNDKGKHKKYAHISIHQRRKEKSILLFTNLVIRIVARQKEQ